MIKATVLYGHPTSPEAFEKYYSDSHHPLVLKTPGIAKWESTKFLPNPDGSDPAYYRLAELYFNNQEEMQQVMGSAEGQALAADLPNFATGGATVIMGVVEN